MTRPSERSAKNRRIGSHGQPVTCQTSIDSQTTQRSRNQRSRHTPCAVALLASGRTAHGVCLLLSSECAQGDSKLRSSRMKRRPGSNEMSDQCEGTGGSLTLDPSHPAVISSRDKVLVCQCRPGTQEATGGQTARGTRAVSLNRSGLTLLEVVLSIGIFLSSMAVLSQLLSTGVRAAVQARWQTQAILRCDSKMAEIVAGIEPLQDVSESGFEDDEDDVWRWNLTIGDGPIDGLYELNVTVWRTANDEGTLSKVSYTLTRYFFDRQAASAESETSTTETES